MRKIRSMKRKERFAKHKARHARKLMVHYVSKVTTITRVMHHYAAKAKAAKLWKHKLYKRVQKKKSKERTHKLKKVAHIDKKEKLKAAHQKKKDTFWKHKL